MFANEYPQADFILKNINALRACQSIHDLAALLNLKGSTISFELYKVPDSAKYTTFLVPKKSGGSRAIDAPHARLKLLQKRLARLLADCLAEIESDQMVDESCALAHGFHRGRSTITNASIHRNRRTVINFDLSDFFPSINFGRVQGYFQKNRYFLLNPRVALVIAQITCHRGVLPQGAPTSPVISNLIANSMDIHLSRMASAARCSYSRYADDITLSTNEKKIPRAIAYLSSSGSGHEWVIGDGLRSRVFRSGFTINDKKTRSQYTSSRQDVTGLVVNSKVNVKTEFYRQARAVVDSFVRRGYGYRQDSTGPASAKLVSRDVCRGMLAHIFLVRGREFDHKRIIKDAVKSPPAFYGVMRRFLDFDRFHSHPQTMIICEGKTDNVYIRAAIRNLWKKFPALLKSSHASADLAVSLFRYSRQTDAVQMLGGGTGDLAQFIQTYKHFHKLVSADKGANPVIVFIDNDDGAKPIYSVVKQVNPTLGTVDGKKSYYHVTDNLYVVPTPLLPGKTKTAIEDFFEPSLLLTQVGGKKFNPSSKTFDRATDYGKEIFAQRVVKSGQAAIDFSGFAEILKRIEKVRKIHAKAVIGNP